MSVNDSNLEHLKNIIESLSKSEQIQILKIFKENAAVKLNENKSGVFVNLSFLPTEVIRQLEQYIEYIKDQEKNLKPVEEQKTEFINTYFFA